MRKLCRRDKRTVGNSYAVVQLVLLLDAAQDRDRVLDRGFLDDQRLETTGKGRVLLNVFPVFIQRRGTDAVQLSARQCRFDQVGRVHRTIRLARTDQRVHLVDEQDDLARGCGNFVQHRLEPLLEFAAILGPGDERTHVEREELLVSQGFRHITIDDAQGHAFCNGRLAHTRLTDENWVVLGPTRQNLHRAADLLVASDDRVNLALARCLGQVARVLLEGIIPFFGARTVGGATLSDIFDCCVQSLRIDCTSLKRLAGLRFHHVERHQHAFDSNETVAGLLREFFSLAQNLGKLPVHVDLAGIARHLGLLFHGQIDRLTHTFGRAPRTLDQIGRKPLIIVH